MAKTPAGKLAKTGFLGAGFFLGGSAAGYLVSNFALNSTSATKLSIQEYGPYADAGEIMGLTGFFAYVAAKNYGFERDQARQIGAVGGLGAAALNALAGDHIIHALVLLTAAGSLIAGLGGLAWMGLQKIGVLKP